MLSISRKSGNLRSGSGSTHQRHFTAGDTNEFDASPHTIGPRPVEQSLKTEGARYGMSERDAKGWEDAACLANIKRCRRSVGDAKIGAPSHLPTYRTSPTNSTNNDNKRNLTALLNRHVNEDSTCVSERWKKRTIVWSRRCRH